jgi:hypothetical protein
MGWEWRFIVVQRARDRRSCGPPSHIGSPHKRILPALGMLLVVALVLLLASLLWGCARMSEPVLEPTSTPAGIIGDMLRLSTGGGGTIAVTFDKVKRLPNMVTQDGQVLPHTVLFGVHLDIKNVGSVGYDDKVPDCARLGGSGEGGNQVVVYPPALQGALSSDFPRTLSAVSIAPGESEAGWVWFAVRAWRASELLEYAPTGGELGEWQLPK